MQIYAINNNKNETLQRLRAGAHYNIDLHDGLKIIARLSGATLLEAEMFLFTRLKPQQRFRIYSCDEGHYITYNRALRRLWLIKCMVSNAKRNYSH